MKKKEKDIFNPAFKDLKKRVRVLKDVPVNHDVKSTGLIDELHDDLDLFDHAMLDVTPIVRENRSRVPRPEKNLKPAHSVSDDEEVVAHLQNLVAGSIDMDISFSDEYIEGSISGVGRNIMKRLKKGQFPIQAHIDLHGLTRKDAETHVRRFLINSQRRGLRCVLIVHGRGLNSPDSIPVLKERLPVWLNRGPARKIVMGFATARSYDGGTGAIYVLLRGKAQGAGRKD
jgi:DNA-nicking Smr family endonuclease